MGQTIERLNPRPRSFVVIDEEREVEVHSYRTHDNYWSWADRQMRDDAKPLPSAKGQGLYISTAVKNADKGYPIQVFYGLVDSYVRDGYLGAFDRSERHAGRLRWWGATEENPKGGAWTFFPDPATPEIASAIAS